MLTVPDNQTPIQLTLTGCNEEGWHCNAHLLTWSPISGNKLLKRGPYFGSTVHAAVTEALTALGSEGL